MWIAKKGTRVKISAVATTNKIIIILKAVAAEEMLLI